MNFGAMNLLEYGVFDSRVKFLKECKTQPRRLDSYEIELYTEDQPGVGYVDDKEILLRRGTLICAKPGMIRCSRLPFKCLYLHLQTQDAYLTQLLQGLPTSCLLMDTTPLIQMFRKLLLLDPKTFPNHRLLLQGGVLELLFQINYEARGDKPELQYSHAVAIGQTEVYIREHLSEELNLKTLAKGANLSASYFHKLFTGRFGVTPTEYVMQCRISAAKTMLLEGELSLDDIAEQCGFSSRSYFNYCFKQRTGQSPGQFRKENLSKLFV